MCNFLSFARLHRHPLDVLVVSDYIEYRLSGSVVAQATRWVQAHVWRDDLVGDVAEVL